MAAECVLRTIRLKNGIDVKEEACCFAPIGRIGIADEKTQIRDEVRRVVPCQRRYMMARQIGRREVVIDRRRPRQPAASSSDKQKRAIVIEIEQPGVTDCPQPRDRHCLLARSRRLRC